MSPEQKESPKFGLSTTCFLDSGLREGPNYLWAAVTRQPYLPEIGASLQVAQNLGLGLELVYRNGADPKTLALLEEGKVPTLQVHGPIWYDLPTSFRQGLEEASKLGATVDPFLSFLALGTLKKDFRKCLELTQKLDSSQVVLHPRGTEILHQKGLLKLMPSYGVNLAIEPDHRRPNPTDCWIWQAVKALAIAQKTNQGICMDTSHTIISQRSVDYLCQTYEQYKRAPKGVLSIHLSAAIPSDEPWVMHRERNGGLPLDPRRVPLDILGAFREFYQHLLRDRFSGSIIVELFEFKGLDKEEAIYNTLNSLETTPKLPPSVSLEGKPTTRR